MFPSRAENKPVPKSYKGWLKEYEGIKKLLVKIRPFADDMGEDWVKGMAKYNRERLTHLEKHRPKTPLKRK